MKSIYLAITLSLLALSTAVAASQPDSTSSEENLKEKTTVNRTVPAKELNAAQIARNLKLENAQIKSPSDLRRHRTLASINNSPLKALSQQGKHRFLESAEFNERGLSTYRYDILEKELTPTEIYRILQLFGMEESTHMFSNARVETEQDRQILEKLSPASFCEIQSIPDGTEEIGIQLSPSCDDGGRGGPGWNNMRCDSPGTCVHANNMICTYNC